MFLVVFYICNECIHVQYKVLYNYCISAVCSIILVCRLKFFVCVMCEYDNITILLI